MNMISSEVGMAAALDAASPEESNQTVKYLTMMRNLRTSIGHSAPPRGFHYMSIEDFVLKRGTEYELKPIPLYVHKGKMKMCFKNATDVVMSDQERFAYVEGYAKGYIPTLHAWVLDRMDGKIFDPTWDIADREITGKDYYGVVFPTSVLYAMLVLTEKYSLLDSWNKGWPILRIPAPDFLRSSKAVITRYIKKLEREVDAYDAKK